MGGKDRLAKKKNTAFARGEGGIQEKGTEMGRASVRVNRFQDRRSPLGREGGGQTPLSFLFNFHGGWWGGDKELSSGKVAKKHRAKGHRATGEHF